MPAWLLPLLETVVPLILKDLVNAQAINEAQKLEVEALIGSEEFLGKLKAYYSYPDDQNAPAAASNINPQENQ